MERRSFLALTAGALASGSAGACSLRRASGAPTPADEAPLDVARFHQSRRFADLDLGRIAYLARGKGPGALFLHGFPLNGYQWRGVVDVLRAHRRCITPDFMGLGYSEVPAGQSLTLDAQAAMLAQLLDRLHIPHVDLVANDSGGATAQLFAVRYPRRVRTMLLTDCDTEPDSPPASFLPVIAAARAGKLADAVARQLDHPDLARSVSGLGGLAYTDPAHLTDDTLQCYLAPLVSTPVRRAQLEAFTIALERNPLAGIEPALRRLRVPTRILWGTADTTFSPAGADWLDRILPLSRGVRRIPGAKLFFPEEMPGLVAAEASELWASPAE
jgi:pimeloyl-ACP methyl ester carboxylesterase